MKIFIAADHAAFEFKNSLNDLLGKDHEVINLGTDGPDSCHYPEYAEKLCKEVVSEAGSRGILCCGSGIGMSMMANKFKGIRAALCRTLEEAELSRQHNNANVLCLGTRTTDQNLLKEIVQKWMSTDFEGGRHQIRIDMMDARGEKL